MKNVVKLEHYYLPCEVEKFIAERADHYKNERYHEPVGNNTPADVYQSRRNNTLDQCARVKARTSIHWKQPESRS